MILKDVAHRGTATLFTFVIKIRRRGCCANKQVVIDLSVLSTALLRERLVQSVNIVL